MFNNRFNQLLKHPGYNDIGTALSVGGSLLGGMMESDAAGDAAKESRKATAASNAMLEKQAKTNTADFSPYTGTGSLANARLEYFLGLTPEESIVNDYEGKSLVSTSGQAPTFNEQLYIKDPAYRKAWDEVASRHFAVFGSGYTKQSSPEWINAEVLKLLPASYTKKLDKSDGLYGSLMKKFDINDLNNDVVYNSGLQFGLDEGVKGLNRQAAAGGSLNSGATLKALTRYANDYGSTKAQQAFENFQTNKANIYNMLSGQQGIGLNATQNKAGINSNLMTGQASNIMNDGTNQGNAKIAEGSAWSNAINGGIGNYIYGQRTKAIAGNY